jgi:hypothetical protein
LGTWISNTTNDHSYRFRKREYDINRDNILICLKWLHARNTYRESEGHKWCVTLVKTLLSNQSLRNNGILTRKCIHLILFKVVTDDMIAKVRHIKMTIFADDILIHIKGVTN